LGEYFASTTGLPRSEQTNATHERLIGRVLEIEIEAIP